MQGVERSAQTTAVLDLRTYRLVPGGGDAFGRILCEEALPMLRGAGIHVLGYGPSLADIDHYFLARAFSTRAEREHQLAAFYGSDEWLQNYDAKVAALIESFHTVVIPLGSSIAEVLAVAAGFEGQNDSRVRRNSEVCTSDEIVAARRVEMEAVAELHSANDRFIRAFVESDTSWYATHLSGDFVCTLADGRRIDKARFLRRIAAGPGVTNVRYDEVDVRLLGDVALVQGVTHCLRDGVPESTRYTDIWLFREGMWQAVAAQLTPVPATH
jgi:hypothetical protein